MAMRGCRLMRTDSSPSEISSSEMPDSSSSSISFFTFRISIRELLEEAVVLSFAQAQCGGFERQLVAERTQPENASDCDIREIGSVPKLFARENVAEVDLDEWNGNAQQRIPQCNTRMSQSARIDQDELHGVLRCIMNRRNEFMLGIALQAQQVDLQRSSALLEPNFDGL